MKDVSLRIHRADSMYVLGQADHYLSVGLSATRCIRCALESQGDAPAPETVLDFPCGYGRVLRFLKIVFPDAEIVGGDIDSAAVDFCHRAFDVKTFVSGEDLNALTIVQKFDLIWCGSLMTHLNEGLAVALLRVFDRCLTDQGACVFTTHGVGLVESLRKQVYTYGLPAFDQHQILQDLDASGYGYAALGRSSDFGISVVKSERMIELASRIGSWTQVLFLERGWDTHQDVYAFARNPSELGESVN